MKKKNQNIITQIKRNIENKEHKEKMNMKKKLIKKLEKENQEN